MKWDGQSRCPGGGRRPGNPARWPLPVTVIAVTGAVKAVTGAVTGAVKAVIRIRDPAPTVTGAVPAVTAGRSSLAESPGQRPGSLPLATPESLAH